MKKLKFVVSLTTDDNDYQQEQASSALESAARLGVDVELLYAENDSVLQSQQLLKAIQSNPEARPAGIIFEPVGATAMPQVARAAAGAGMGWVVLNRDVEYLSELRQSFKFPSSPLHPIMNKSAGFRVSRSQPCFPRVDRSCWCMVRPRTLPQSNALPECNMLSRPTFR